MALRVDSFYLGSMVIHPKPAGTPKTIRALRLFAKRVDKQGHAPYYDLTYQSAITAVLPFLENFRTARSKFTFRAVGSGPRKQIGVEVEP